MAQKTHRSKPSFTLTFTALTWEDYLYWKEQDQKISERIDQLLKECRRSPFDGLEKPEPLRGDLTGFWSRRITTEHRLVYRYGHGALEIVQARYHY